MTFGCFVDIAMQDGTKQRMLYGVEHLATVKWIGINEQMAEKFRKPTRTTPTPPTANDGER